MYLKTQGVSPNEHPIKAELVFNFIITISTILIFSEVCKSIKIKKKGKNQTLYQES